MTLRTITAPVDYLVSLEEAKAHLRVDFDDDDELIRGLIMAATEFVEARTQRRYATQTLEWVLDEWRCDMRLPVAPVASIEWVKYADMTDQMQVLDPSRYIVMPCGQTKALTPQYDTFWPYLGLRAPERIVIRFVAGTDFDDIPAAARVAAMLLVGAWYENREEIASGSAAPQRIPVGVDALLLAETWS